MRSILPDRADSGVPSPPVPTSGQFDVLELAQTLVVGMTAEQHARQALGRHEDHVTNTVENAYRFERDHHTTSAIDRPDPGEYAPDAGEEYTVAHVDPRAAARDCAGCHAPFRPMNDAATVCTFCEVKR